ncbi:MAG: hypothetical protein ACYC7E_06455 [Armatimonadota bacterium]
MTVYAACTSMLGLLTEIEVTITRIYQAFAAQFSDQAEVWGWLAEEEKRHTQLVRDLQIAAEEGVIAINLRAFNRTRLESFLWHLQKVLERATKGEYKADEALETAQALESTMIEQGFYHVAFGKDTRQQEVFDTLEASAHCHADRLAQLEAADKKSVA